MVDRYMHDYDNVALIVNSLKKTQSSYEDKINEFKTLISNISSSNAWIDAELKTAFIDCCNNYMSLYDRVSQTMTGYISYLEKKSEGELISTQTKYYELLNQSKSYLQTIYNNLEDL